MASLSHWVVFRMDSCMPHRVGSLFCLRLASIPASPALHLYLHYSIHYISGWTLSAGCRVYSHNSIVLSQTIVYCCMYYNTPPETAKLNRRVVPSSRVVSQVLSFVWFWGILSKDYNIIFANSAVENEPARTNRKCQLRSAPDRNRYLSFWLRWYICIDLIRCSVVGSSPLAAIVDWLSDSLIGYRMTLWLAVAVTRD